MTPLCMWMSLSTREDHCSCLLRYLPVTHRLHFRREASLELVEWMIGKATSLKFQDRGSSRLARYHIRGPEGGDLLWLALRASPVRTSFLLPTATQDMTFTGTGADLESQGFQEEQTIPLSQGPSHQGLRTSTILSASPSGSVLEVSTVIRADAEKPNLYGF